MSLKKKYRNELIKQMAKQPNVTYEMIAGEFGITKQRVNQIIKGEKKYGRKKSRGSV